MLRVIAGIGILQVAVVLVNMLRSKIVAVLLGPEGVGAIGVVDQLVQLILYICTLNLPFVAVRFLSRAHSEGPESFRQTFATFIRALLVITGVGAVCGVALALLRPDILGNTFSDYRVLLLPALIGIPAMACQGLFSNVLAAARRTRAAALTALTIAAALATSSFVGIQAGGVPGFYWGNLIANSVVAVGIAVYLNRSLRLPFFGRIAGFRQELKKSPEILLFAIVFYANSLAFSFSFFVARFTILSNFGEAEAGILQAGVAIYTSFNLILGPANGLYLTPAVNRRGSATIKLAAAMEFQRKLWIIVLLLGMGMVLFAPWVVVVLFSPAFLSISSIVLLFILAQCIYQIVGVHYALLIGLDDIKMYGPISVVGHLSLAGIAWLLAPGLGIAGIGIAFLAGSVVHFVLTFIRLRLRFGMHLPVRWWIAFGYGLIGLTVGGLISNMLSPWEILPILARCIILGLFAISLLAMLDRQELRHAVVRGRELLLRAEKQSELRVAGALYRRLTQPFFPEVW
jgi:PST family polysaccharide transporter